MATDLSRQQMANLRQLCDEWEDMPEQAKTFLIGSAVIRTRGLEGHAVPHFILNCVEHGVHNLDAMKENGGRKIAILAGTLLFTAALIAVITQSWVGVFVGILIGLILGLLLSRL